MMSTTKVMMTRRSKDWVGYWILDDNGVCVAKTCSACRNELPAEDFGLNNKLKYRKNTRCRKCISSSEKIRNSTLNEDGEKVFRKYNVSVVQKNKARSPEEVIAARDRIYPDGIKECYRCGKIKPLDDFGKDAASTSGLNSRCRACVRTLSRENGSIVVGDTGLTRRQLSKARSKSKLSRRTPLQVKIDRDRLRPEGVKRCRSCRKYLEFSEFYGDITQEDGLNSKCTPCAVDSDKIRRNKQHRSMWEGAGVALCCYVCLEAWSVGHHSDHVIPRALGGSDELHNRLPLCPDHNRSKWMTPLEIWLRESMPEKMDEILDRVSGYGVDYRVPDGVYDGVKVFTDGDGLLQWERGSE